MIQIIHMSLKKLFSGEQLTEYAPNYVTIWGSLTFNRTLLVYP
jgi:hypothetical protein